MPKPAVDQLKQIIAKAERQGLTRYRLAKIAGVTEGGLSRLVAGENMPKLDTAQKIAEAIGYELRFIPKENT